MSVEERGYRELEEFLRVWPAERVNRMILEEYTNGNLDSFCYYLEFKTGNAGGIRGGAASKFGIFYMKNKDGEGGPGIRTDGAYRWAQKYGADAESAFQVIKKRLVEVIEAALAGEFGRVDDIDLGPVLKWKVAYMYSQDRILPIFDHESLLQIAHKLGLSASSRPPVSELQRFLIGKKPDGQSVLTFAGQLWTEQKNVKVNVFFAPRRREHKGEGVSQSSITDGLPWENLEPYLDSASKQILQGRKRYYVWGNSSSSSWDKMKGGDWVFFYADGKFYAAGKVLHKAENEGLSVALWGHARGEGAWKYLYFLGSILEVDVPWETYTRLGNFGKNYVVQKFQPIQPEILKRILRDYGTIESFLETESKEEQYGKTYSKEDALAELFVDKPHLERMLRALERKKNLILEGPPGTGKTFIARRLAYVLLGEKNNYYLQSSQFHPSFSYEDFVQGYRPGEGGKIERRNGVFYQFCQRAQEEPGKKFVFIIDEINRANVSKVFGELMTLLECDKRGEAFKMPLTYSVDSEEAFSIPENLYVIGTMNTADRSIAIVDYALRRRFAFEFVEPQITERLRGFLAVQGATNDLIDRIIDRLRQLNAQIEKDPNLGKGYCIGHSYFCPKTGLGEDQEQWFMDIVNDDIMPLLREYWFDSSEQVGKASDLLESK